MPLYKLTARLEEMKKLIQDENKIINCVADVGCDHGYLSVDLLESGICKSVIASDISKPSLEKASQLASSMGVEDNMKTVVSDGLSHLDDGQAQVIAIAGMGGELISEILQKNESVARSAEKIVMQPMSGFEELRRFLYNNSYRILEERLVKEGRRIYQVMSVVSGDAEPLPDWWNENMFFVGYDMFKNHDALIEELLLNLRKKYCRSLDNSSVQPENLIKNIADIDVLLEKLKEENNEN